MQRRLKLKITLEENNSSDYFYDTLLEIDQKVTEETGSEVRAILNAAVALAATKSGVKQVSVDELKVEKNG